MPAASTLLRRPTWRRASAVAALAAASLVLPGCFSKTQGERDKLLVILREAAAKPAAYSWEQKSDLDLQVDGLTEDDFRYQGTATVDGTQVLEQRVLDDAIMVKVDAPDRLPSNVGVGETPVPADQPGAGRIPEAALREGAWIIDPDAAPGVAARRVTTTTQAIDDGLGPRGGPIRNRDVILDANSYLQTVIAYVTAAPAVTKFNEESPEYRPREDPFEHPKNGQVRYDLFRPDVPRLAGDDETVGAADQGGKKKGESSVPSMEVYRKLSVYVKDGEVVRVAERVQLDERADQTVRLMKSVLKEKKFPVSQQESFARAADKGGASRDDAIAIAINLIGRLPGQTFVPFSFSTTEYTRRAPEETEVVDLPTDLVLGDLTRFFQKADANGQIVSAPSSVPAAAPAGSATTAATTATSNPG